VALRAMARGVPANAGCMTQFATLTPGRAVEQAVQTLLRTARPNSRWWDAAGRRSGLLGRNDLIRA